MRIRSIRCLVFAGMLLLLAACSNSSQPEHGSANPSAPLTASATSSRPVATASAIHRAVATNATRQAAVRAAVARRGEMTGLILDKGTPLPGVTIDVEAWPNGHRLSKIKEKGSVKTVSIGTVTTSADGRFSIPLRTAALSAAYREGVHTVNCDIDVDSVAGGQDTFTRWSVPLAISARTHVADAVTAVVDLGRKTIVLNGHRSSLAVSVE